MKIWRELIAEEMQQHAESWECVESIAGELVLLDQPFRSGDSEVGSTPFTVWTANRVYFPVYYDSSVWCASVSRNPDGVATEQI